MQCWMRCDYSVRHGARRESYLSGSTTIFGEPSAYLLVPESAETKGMNKPAGQLFSSSVLRFATILSFDGMDYLLGDHEFA
jgi:hypothetical protein